MPVNRSTIYIMCPHCGKNGLLLEEQGRYFCAVCMYDYLQLKDDPGRLESVLLETIRQQGFGLLFASALYQKVTLTPSVKANEYIRQLAAKNGIDLFRGHRISSGVIGWLLKLFNRGRA